MKLLGIIVLTINVIISLIICSTQAFASSVAQNKLYSASFLVLDMDGDGVDLIPLKKSQIYFDVDGDGLAERTSWVGPKDAILLIIPDDFNQKYNTNLAKRFFAMATGGFKFLENFDFNGDKIIDDKDQYKVAFNNTYMRFGSAIWRDMNSDGIMNLDEQNYKIFITRLSLKDISKKKGEYLLNSGKAGKIEEVNFEYEDSNVKWAALCERAQSGYTRWEDCEYKPK